jgi:hypothetical protein
MAKEKKEETKGGEVKVKRGDLTVVAEDTNWRTYVSKELHVANQFNEDWGFLTKAAQGKYSIFFMRRITASVRWTQNCYKQN